MKYIAAIATVVYLTNPINANAFGLGDLSKAASFAKSAKRVAAPATGVDRCAPLPDVAQSLAPMERAKSMATKKAIEFAINRLTAVLGGTEPVGLITNYCDVDKKLAALEVETLRLGNYVKSSTQKSLDALSNGDTSAATAYSDTSGTIGGLVKDIKKNSKKAAKKASKVKSGQGVNSELLNESMADLNASLRPAALLLAHDLALVDFIKDHPRWAVENVGQAKLFASQMNLLVAAGTAVQKIREATLANENLAVDADELAAATLLREQIIEAQAAQQLEAYDLNGMTDIKL